MKRRSIHIIPIETSQLTFRPKQASLIRELTAEATYVLLHDGTCTCDRLDHFMVTASAWMRDHTECGLVSCGLDDLEQEVRSSYGNKDVIRAVGASGILMMRVEDYRLFYHASNSDLAMFIRVGLGKEWHRTTCVTCHRETPRVNRWTPLDLRPFTRL